MIFSRRRTLTVLATLSALILGLSFWSLSAGAVKIPLAEVLNALFADDLSQNYIINQSRLPRLILALLTGGSLALSGAIVQSVLRNPLASPKIIGINSGAGFFACAAILLFPQIPATWLPMAAALGGIFAALAIFLIAHFKKVSPAHLALIGIGIGFLFEAGIDYFLVSSNDHEFSTPLVWLTGSLWGRTWQHVDAIKHLLLLLSITAIVLAYSLDILYLGDETATTLGIRVPRRRLTLLLVATLLASVSVGVVGVMGFVGLMAPHIARQLVGGSHRALLPVAALIGMSLVVFADALGRVIAPPIEVSAGVLTAFIGAPFFAYLMISNRGKWE